jgi:alpha-2-macroglobulin
MDGMGKNASSAVSIALAGFGLLFLSGCGHDGSDKSVGPVPPPGESKGELRILSSTPNGPTRNPSEAGAIVVVFDRPMVALEAPPDGKGASFLRIAPPVRGKHRWLGTRALAFTPDEHLPYATRFEVTVPAGTRSLDGYRLAADHVWEFWTIRPRVIGSFPADGQRNLKPATKILLVFNQTVDKVRASNSIGVVGISPDGGAFPVRFGVTTPSEKLLKDEEIKAAPGEVLLLEPRTPLKPDFAYAVEVAAGFRGADGPLGSDKTYAFKFETFKTFGFESLSAREGHDPRQPLKFQFTNPVTYAEFLKNVRFEPDVAVPDYYSEWDEASPVIWLNLPLEPETDYFVRIPAGLKDEFGNVLGKDVASLKFRTAPYRSSISMTTGHGVVEAYGDPVYPVYAMNAERVLFRAANVPREAVVPLLTRDKVFWTNEDVRPDPAAPGMERVLEFHVPRNKRQAVPLDLKPVLADRFGLIFVQLDTGSADKYDRYPKAFVQVTELAISAKFSPENNEIWVTELRTGEPVADAGIELRSDANEVRWTGRTDASGRVETPGWRMLGLKGRDEWSRPQQWVFARRGRDVAFTSSEWGTGVYPYRFGIEYDWNPRPETVHGQIFSERGIYRAGETVHLKGIVRVREKGRWRLPSVREVDCEVRDPFQRSVHKGKAVLDAFGSFAFDLETTTEAALGTYEVTASVPPEAGGGVASTLSGSLRVEAFRAAEFEVLLRTPLPGFVFGEEYRGDIRADYLSGGALAGEKASWHLRLGPAAFTPPGHKGFTFGNPMEEDEGTGAEGSRLIASGEGRLDAQGRLEIRSPLAAEKEKDSVLATLEATVESPSRSQISNRIRTMVHRGEFYIGLRPGTSFAEKGKDLSLDVSAVDPAGVFVPGHKITVRLLRREWRSVRQAGVGGRFRWHTEREDAEVASREVESGPGPVGVGFKAEKSGLYVLSAACKDGRGNPVTSSTYVYVTGDDYVSWERRDDDSVELVADAEEYKPGETARILVKSPYERAKALVTVEREFILDSRVVEIEGSTSRIEVPIESGHIPNVFVSVVLVQGRTGAARADENADVGKPSFKMGYVKLAVDPFEKRLRVDVARDKREFRPGELVTLRFKVRDSREAAVKACLSVAVVDVGVLNLIGYETPDPFGRFYGEKPLSVQSSETRLHVVGQREYGEKGEDPGGGAGGNVLSVSPALTEVELRGDFKSTAYWSPALLTDAFGEASATFKLPSNLTSFKVMAVAQTVDSSFGRGDDVFRVTRPLQLQPSVPRFVRAGDRFEAGVVVRNLSDRGGRATLELKASDITCANAGARTVTLGPGDSREVLFPFNASNPGRARLAFRVSLGEETDGLETYLDVRLDRTLETVALTGTAGDRAEEILSIPESPYPERSRLDLRVSPTALSGLKGALDHLREYPYSCLEQRVSAVLPYLVASKVVFDLELGPLDEPAARRYVRAALRGIYACQRDDGSFGPWPDSTWVSPYVTCYALFGLIQAKKSGYDVVPFRIDQAAQYLKDWLREDYDPRGAPFSRAAWAATRAFALYDLALLGRPETSYAEKLTAERQGMPLFGRAYLLKALRAGRGTSKSQGLLRDELLNLVKITPTEAHFEEGDDPSLDWAYSSNLRTTAIILQTLIEAGIDSPLIPQIARWIVARRESGHWRSTQEDLYVLYALSDYFRVYEEGTPDFGYRVALDTRTVLQGTFREWRVAGQQVSLGLSDLRAGKKVPLTITKDGKGTLYYDARMTYAPGRRLEAVDEGIAVIKRLETPEGKPLGEVKAGSLVMITLDIVLPHERHFVVVDDPLPAGFEAVNPRFLTESEERQRELDRSEEGDEERWWEGFGHVEMRDDRVLLFAESLTAGLHTRRYLARARTLGTFLLPGARASEMYAPEVFGRGPESAVTIVR